MINCKALLVSCPHCGKEHEHKYKYKGVPILACPEAEADKIYSFSISLEALEVSKDKEKLIVEIKQRIEQAERKLKEQATALYFEDIEK